MSEPNEHTLEVDKQTESLEQRVKRLEDALASMQDTRMLEDRIFERVSTKLKAEPPPEPPKPVVPPAPTPPVTNTSHEQVTETSSRSHANASAGLQNQAESYLSRASGVSPEVIKQSWILLDIWKEFRTILSMFFDIRYKMSWVIRWTVTILFIMIVTSGFWTPLASVPLVGPVLSSLVNLLLAFIMIKILIREADRYRATRY